MFLLRKSSHLTSDRYDFPDINECAPAPCLNGGTCVDLVGNFRCDCAAGWLGNTCSGKSSDLNSMLTILVY